MKEVSAKKLSTKQSKLKNSTEKEERKEGSHWDLPEFVIRHFRIQNWKDFSGHPYFAIEVIQLLNDVIEIFRSEKTLCHISPPITIVGDLNGHFQDLIRIFNIKYEKSKKDDEYKQVFATEKFVFLGDYTEESPYNLETICLLFGLKMLYQHRYILLRGHQETIGSSPFRDQILKRFPEGPGEEIWQKFKIAFSLMPVAAVVGDKIMCVHSGITADVKKSVDEFKKLPKTEQFSLHATVRELIFSYPMKDNGVGAESNEPTFFTSVERKQQTRVFNEAAVKEFCDKTKIELIVRSHDIPPNGFRFFAGKRMITIFSAPTHQNYKHKGAFLRVDLEGVVSIIQLRPTDKKAEERPKKKRSGESGKKSEDKESKESAAKDSKEKTKDSKEKTKGSKDDAKESKESGKKKTNSKQSKEMDSIYDNVSEKGSHG